MQEKNSIFNIAVIIAALGYFVDIFDLVLFGVVKDVSLTELGYSGQELLNKGVLLLNLQMAGMLLGGVLWGILGDKRGRVSVLFGSIFLYSAANIANGFVTDIPTYALLRFIAGIGLAGELGAGITLVTESMPLNKRGYGTMIVVVVGALGAVFAAIVGDPEVFNWRTTYFIGGGLGLALLLLRVGTYESGMFRQLHNTNVRRGDFLSLFTDKNRFRKYIACIMVGLPVWFTIGILIFFARNFSQVLGIQGVVSTGTAIMYAYLGLSAGDLISGFLSQWLRSRKKVVLVFITLNFGLTIIYLFTNNYAAQNFYFLCFALGCGTGFWAIFVTIAAEQFGTNLRATVTTTVPNFVRGAVVPLTASFVALQAYVGLVYSAVIVGIISTLLAFIATVSLKESFSKDLNYVEEIS